MSVAIEILFYVALAGLGCWLLWREIRKFWRRG